MPKKVDVRQRRDLRLQVMLNDEEIELLEKYKELHNISRDGPALRRAFLETVSRSISVDIINATTQPVRR